MPWPTTSRHERGYGTDWDKLRKRILERDRHLCQVCLPRVTAGNHVDHVLSKAKGGTDDEGNLQTLCRPCHEAKTAADIGQRVKAKIGSDGWPEER